MDTKSRKEELKKELAKIEEEINKHRQFITNAEALKQRIFGAMMILDEFEKKASEPKAE